MRRFFYGLLCGWTSLVAVAGYSTNKDGWWVWALSCAIITGSEVYASYNDRILKDLERRTWKALAEAEMVRDIPVRK